MAGGFHYYFEAARALWEMPSGELYSHARGDSEAMQRAAELTLRLKAEYVTPESFRNERSALTKLATALSEDPEFSLELAMEIGRGRPSITAVPEEIRWVTRRSPRSIALWVAVLAGITLLLLDVLATAGVPVPTPIGDLLDRVTGEDVAPQTPAPPPSSSGAGTDIGPRYFLATTVVNEGIVARSRDARTQVAIREGDDDKNALHKNGKERNYQNGKERNYQNGKEQHYQEGRERNGPASARSKSRIRSYALERTNKARENGRDAAQRARRKRQR